jgi:uncharacterized membrane protein
VTLTAVLALAAGTYALRLTGLWWLATRPLSPEAEEAVGLLPLALIGGLIAVQTLGGGEGVVLDARLLGVAAAIAAAANGAPLAVTMLVGAATASLLRATVLG